MSGECVDIKLIVLYSVVSGGATALSEESGGAIVGCPKSRLSVAKPGSLKRGEEDELESII